METIAVYWEERVRTYGFQVKSGLMALRIDLPADRLGEWSEQIEKLSAADVGSYQWAFAQPGDEGRIALWLIYDPQYDDCPSKLLDRHSGNLPVAVDVVVFQGPHYGDRYGIADFTLRALQKHRIPLLTMICCVASISLVLPEQWGQKTKEVLTGEFEIPMTKPEGPLH